MPNTNELISNFVGGEVSPLMYGRIDAPIYKKGLAKAENFIILPQGPAQYRNGTVFVTNTRLNQAAFLLPFNFSDQQTYVVECTPLKMRFYTNNGIVTNNDTIITAITQANPAVVTDTAHGYVTGQTVQIANVQGMTQVNGGGGAAFAAANMNGTTQWLSHADVANLRAGAGSFSIAAWVNFSALGARQDVVTKKGAGNAGDYAVYKNASDNLNFGVFNGATQLVVSTALTVTANTWYFIAAWFDSVANTINIQINNGVVTSVSAVSFTITATANDFEIGSGVGGTEGLLSGSASCVGFWQRTLLTNEITQLWNNAAPLIYINLPAAMQAEGTATFVSYWNLDFAGSVWNDSRTTANNLTSHGVVTESTAIAPNTNGYYSILVLTANTFAIGANSTGYGAYTASGKATAIYYIDNITIANPGVFSVLNHGFSNGDAVFLANTGIGFDAQQLLVANVTANSFTLTDLFGNAISTVGTNYTGTQGTVARIYEVTTPYTAADIPNLQYAQSADVLYIVHQNYAPMKLVRNASSNWTMGTFSRTGTDPFPSAGNYPRSVSFDSAGRLWYGGTLNNPQTLWGSSAPSSGTTAFDDFTLGTAATNSVIFTLAPLFSGKVDYVEWISNTNQFMVIGTFGSVRTLWGSAEGSPVTPSSITAQPASVVGGAYTLPVANGDTLFYVQRGGQRVRSLEYDFYISGFTTKDQTIASDHLTQVGIQQMVQQRGYPDVMWCPRGDGRFLGFTYSRPEIENYAAWHRHFLGGQSTNANGVMLNFGFVNSMAIVPRNSTTDQIWFAATRTINGQQICSVEYMADYQQFPNFHDFYGGSSTATGQATDTTAFNNAMFEIQKQSVYLDMAIIYDGSALGRNASVSLTPSTVGIIGGSVTLTASAAIFTAAMVGQQVHKRYDSTGNGGGIIIITSVTDSQHAVGTVYVPFNNTNAMTPGNWYLTASVLTGLNYFGNGQTVSVVADGGPASNAVVSNGSITLQAPATTVIVGFPYVGTLETLNLDTGGKTGTAQSKPRILIKCAIRFLNSVGVTFGTGYYNQTQLTFRQANFQTDRPTVPFTGIDMVQYADSWTQQDQNPQKQVVIIQSLPLPCTVLGIDGYIRTSDDQPNTV